MAHVANVTGLSFVLVPLYNLSLRSWQPSHSSPADKNCNPSQYSVALCWRMLEKPEDYKASCALTKVLPHGYPSKRQNDQIYPARKKRYTASVIVLWPFFFPPHQAGLATSQSKPAVICVTFFITCHWITLGISPPLLYITFNFLCRSVTWELLVAN